MSAPFTCPRRNPLTALTRMRPGAGRHGPNGKAQRQASRRALARELRDACADPHRP